MQSKLSYKQKNLMKDLYFKRSEDIIKECKVKDISSYNSFNHSRNSLIKRGLLKKLNEGKYVKEFGLTEEGFKTIEQILLGKEVGFIIDTSNFELIVDYIIEHKNPYCLLKIQEDILVVECIDNVGNTTDFVV